MRKLRYTIAASAAALAFAAAPAPAQDPDPLADVSDQIAAAFDTVDDVQRQVDDVEEYVFEEICWVLFEQPCPRDP
jgi:hypothetical protein